MWKLLIVMTVWKQNKTKNKDASEVTTDAEIALIQMLV